jgi:[NiFe] hydrogenase assembly HybE family chaperone
MGPDPSAALEAAYRAVALRMAGLPVVNPALEVQAVGFQPWQGHWLGIVITPWFMNLTLAPQVPGQWVALPLGDKRRLRFPAGDFEFISANDAAFGDFQVCSLFSPMHDFADRAAAHLVAQLSLQALFDPVHAELPPQPATTSDGAAGAAIDDDGLADPGKRDFLRGRRRPAASG